MGIKDIHLGGHPPPKEKPKTLPPRSHKSYLGDGAYVDFDGWAIVLTTEDGISVTNRVVLEPEVFRALEAYVARMRGNVAVDGMEGK